MSSTPLPPLLRADALAFRFDDGMALFSDWSADIGPGLHHLYGDTGSGKTTLLRLIAGQLAPSAGRLQLAGDAMRSVFHVDPASERFDALGVQACSAAWRDGDAGFDGARWQSLVEAFGLAPHMDKKMHMLSTGSRRKVGLAAALASGRPLVLLDEPTAALDAASVQALWQALEEWTDARPHHALLLASADPQLPLAPRGRWSLP